MLEGSYTRLDSTEILENPDGTWRTLTTARLPSPRSNLPAATVNNVVYIFGKNCVNVFYNILYYLYFIIVFVVRRK